MPPCDVVDVLIVGGGPAGSSCAWKLRQAGLDVMVMDRAVFPRDKVCAGWITPQVIEDLEIDIGEYRQGRTFQPITGFRTGLIGRRDDVETRYQHPVSYGIRRCEFDHYLLERSGARLKLGAPVSSIRRGPDGAGWLVNGTVEARMLVGAGGHFCPVARWLNPEPAAASLVVAQEAEFPIGAASDWSVAPEVPELYFCRDLQGYGWCFRKGEYLNIGLGRLDRRSLPKATAEFVTFLQTRHRIPSRTSCDWRGHAYLVSEPPRPRLTGDGVVLIGDAAGLAYPRSGEGIRPAIESGLLAAQTILGAGRHYARERMAAYERRLRQRFAVRADSRRALPVASGATAALVPRLLEIPWFVRHLVLDRWFLRARERAITASEAPRKTASGGTSHGGALE